ncbi:dipeptidyl aminopeptidase-like protein 6 isoform X3 [Zootoca vivipara]|uniref:dipeptidyl aminopeptidase-like protein 6 isoform X3 n=1 Tax=Zootoca vivipara TaxID=8524 RepID=UPI00293BB796|nr:dipeptidyl aminopeptidase-like protein 6 isoform X3 [Zootoca vivipara]
MIATHQNITTALNMGFSSSPPRNWKGIGIAMLVVAMLASVIIVAILMLTPEEPPIGFRTPLTLDDLESDDFQLHQPQLHWVTDDELVELSDTGTMMKWHIGQKNSTLLVEDRDLHFLKASRFQVSPDLQFLLLACDVQQVFRYSFTARYLIYNLGTRETSNLDVPKADTAYLQYAAWGAKDNQLVFILDNDIYYQPGVSSRAKRITTSGRQAVVFNGIADWLYEEEILQTASAHWCSPDSMWLAYLSINNSLVPKMELPQFLGGKYPASQHYPYPKAGQPIPSVQLFVVNLSGVLHLLELLPPESFQGREYYITMVKWVGHSRLAVRWLNRPQNMSVLSLCEAATGACTERYKVTSDFWVDMKVRGLRSFCSFIIPSARLATFPHLIRKLLSVNQLTDRQTDRETEGEFSSKCLCQSSSQTINDHSFSKGCQQGMPIFSEDAETLFLPVPVKQGPRGEFHHVTMLSTQPSRKESSVRLLTSGTWDVTRILAYDENSKRLYFLSSEDRLSSKHLYSVELDSSFNRTCVTCGLRSSCSFVDVRFSPRMGNFILFCKGPGVPQISVHRTANPRDFLLLEENRPLQDALMHKEMPLVEFRLYRLASYDLSVRVTLPPPHQCAFCPLLLLLPESPGGQLATEEFHLDWDTVLSSSLGAVVVQFDARGSRNQGLKLLHEVSRQLGSLDVKDHVTLMRWLLQLPYVDRRRTAVYGKAYGGFLALKLMATAEDLFKCGTGVAPITSFRFHAATFSERYLGMPAQEDAAYTMASVLEEAPRLKDKNVLLAHGTGDATVHFQHTAELLIRLLAAESNYTTQIYPDEGHTFKSTQHHLSQSLFSFFRGCFEDTKHSHLLSEEDEDP